MIPAAHLSVLVFALSAVSAEGASFPCDKAQSRIEKAICADAAVSVLDEHLGRYYAAARSALGDAASCLAADQKQWLSTVRNACADPACLKKAYLERLGELDALQPGATAIRNIELPGVPSLAWIVPAAQDRTAAPARPGAKPLVARGRLIDDLAQGDGFVLRTAEGISHIIVLLMFLDGPTGDRLAALAKGPKATFVARGHAAVDPRGHTYYEPSRCVFLYRLP
jgi:uncharacterized protein